MVFLFIFIIIIFIINLIIFFSKISLKVEYFTYKSYISKPNYEATLIIYFLKKFPIIKIKITESKIKKLYNKIKKSSPKEILGSIDRKNIIKNIKKSINILNISINKLDIFIEIGTENAMLTSLLVGNISTFIAYLIEICNMKYENQKFEVKPIFYNKNLLNVFFSGKFEIKIISLIKFLIFVKNFTKNI